MLVVGTYQEPKQAFLIVDMQIISEIDCKDTLLFLLCAFFVFNICYTNGCSNVDHFCEYSLLNIKSTKTPMSVSHLLASLSNNH